MKMTQKPFVFVFVGLHFTKVQYSTYCCVVHWYLSSKSSRVLPPAQPLSGSSLSVTPGRTVQGSGRCRETSQRRGSPLRLSPPAAQRGLRRTNPRHRREQDASPQCHHVGAEHDWHPQGGGGGQHGAERRGSGEREGEGGSREPALSVFSICSAVGWTAANFVWEQ